MSKIDSFPELLSFETLHPERAFALDQPEDLLSLLPLVEFIFDQSPDNSVVRRRGPTAAQRRPDARPAASFALLDRAGNEGGEACVRVVAFPFPRHARPDREYALAVETGRDRIAVQVQAAGVKARGALVGQLPVASGFEVLEDGASGIGA